jgi:hypothetical protein
MIGSRVLAAGLLSLPAFCAAAQDGNSEREMTRLLARFGRLLPPEELRANCAGLTLTIKSRIDRLRELRTQAKKEQEGPPPSLFGGRPAVAAFAKEREHVQALNVVLDAKGCNPVNVEAEMQKAAAPPIPAKAGIRPAERSKSFEK